MQANPAPQVSDISARRLPLPERSLVKDVTPILFYPVRTEMHPGVFKAALACWIFLLGIFWVTFFISAHALFMVAIGSVYAAVFFGTPFIMSRIAGKSAHSRLGLSKFLRGYFGTLDGPISGYGALTQVILVPLSLGIGGVAIGVIIRLARVTAL